MVSDTIQLLSALR